MAMKNPDRVSIIVIIRSNQYSWKFVKTDNSIFVGAGRMYSGTDAVLDTVSQSARIKIKKAQVKN